MRDELTSEIYQYIITSDEIEKIETGDYYNYIMKRAVLVASKLSLEKKKIIDFTWEVSFGDAILTFYYQRYF